MFEHDIIIFDGAIGTELYEKGFYINRPFEELNLTAPSDVVALHKSYINAGAQVLTTNTFSVSKYQLAKFDMQKQQSKLIVKALEHVNTAKNGQDIRIAFSIGPIGELIEPLGKMSINDVIKEYENISTIANHGNFDYYILETFSNVEELLCAVDGIRKNDSIKPIIACLSIGDNQEIILNNFIRNFADKDSIQCIGLNCSQGPAGLLEATKKPILIQPNAGYPRHINGRYFYMTSPDYMAKFAKRFIEAGARAIGGCCGTGPDHIKAMKAAVKMAVARNIYKDLAVTHSLDNNEINIPLSKRKKSKIGQYLEQDKKIISVEILPPKGVDLSKFKNHLKILETNGIDFVNIPDGARASTRISSLHLSAHINNDTIRNITAIPHFTSRDRNLIGLQSDLLGAYINNVSDILLVTGDPPKLGNNKEASAVYDIDAIGLVHLVDSLNKGFSPNKESLGSVKTQYGIGVAANPTAINMEIELKRWQYKCQMGADFAFTQPIFDEKTFIKWLESTKNNVRPHIVGIWPLVSYKNAEFLAGEVPGVFVPNHILEKMQKVSNKPQDALKVGIEIAYNTMKKLEPVCQGFCISAPFGKVEIVVDLLK